MIAEKPSEIVLASAGSGKTFRLTLRLVSLLLRGVSIDRMLASTFTKKAAGEIFDRLLNRLAKAAEHEKDRTDLQRQLADLGVHVEVTRDLLERTLRDFVDRLDRVRIQTLDSFFNRLAHSSALELSIGPGWRIAEDHEDALLREQAAELALQDIDEHARLVLLDMLTTRQAVTSNITGVLLETIDDCHDWLWLAGNSIDPLRTILPESDPLSDGELALLLDDLRVAPVQLTAAGEPNKAWEKARSDLVERAATGDWQAVLGAKLASASAIGDQMFYSKLIVQPLLGLLQRLHAHAASKIINQLAQRNAAAGAVVLGFDHHYRALQQAHGLLRFGDIPRLISEAASADRLLESLYAIDGAIDHLLLDEYQDTSTIQERLLLPIMEEIQGTADRSVFVVGDAKQSLYGWRQAEPELLETLGDRRSIPPTTLEKSWRCSPPVIEAVNLVFERLSGCPQMVDRPARAAAKQWEQRYMPHEAHRTDLAGSVRAEIGPKDRRERFDLAADRVACHAAASEHATIAVLTRGNAGVQAMIERLAALGVPASEEGGGTLTDTPAVRAAVSLLRLACHPGDTMSAYVALHGPLGPLFGVSDAACPDEARRVSAALRHDIAREGLTGVIERIIDRARAQMSPRERARMEQLLAMAWDVDAAGGGAAELAALASRAQRPLSSPDRVRVMTVHKAKGLEFDVVVLPDLDWPLTPRSGGMLIGRSRIGGPVEQMSLCPSRDVAMVHPTLRALYERHAEQTISEGLSILYVAMTRARVRLDMFLGEPPKESSTPTAAAVLRHAFDLEVEKPFVLETGDWTRDIKHPPTVEQQPDRPPPLRLARPSRVRTGRLARRAPSGTHAVSPRDVLSPPSPGMTRGERWHAWLEAIEWLEQKPLPEQLPGGFEHPAEAGRFLALLDGPIGDALRLRSLRLGGAESAAVHREWSFAVRLEDAEGAALVSGRVDRLTIVRDATGAPVRAIVDDLKTDAIDGAGSGQIVERHRGQLALYRRAVAQALGLDAAAVRARLLLTATGTVEEVA